MREITVKRAFSNDVGSCNACTDHMDSNGSIPHAVVNITLRGVSFRLCAGCRIELKEKLARVQGCHAVR
jgi:hypothetical protein